MASLFSGLDFPNLRGSASLQETDHGAVGRLYTSEELR